MSRTATQVQEKVDGAREPGPVGHRGCLALSADPPLRAQRSVRSR
jgi:hypothetical protein